MSATALAPPLEVFDKQKRAKIAELEQTMVRALKEQNFNQALIAARTVLELNPAHRRAAEFVPVLQEKLALDEDSGDDEDDDGDDDGHADQDGNEAEDGQEGDDDDDSDSDSEEDTDEDEDEDGLEQEGTTAMAATAATPAPAGGPAPGVAGSTSRQDTEVESLAAAVNQISLDTSNSQLTANTRARIKRDLAESVKRVKHRDLAAALAAADPLLGA